MRVSGFHCASRQGKLETVRALGFYCDMEAGTDKGNWGNWLGRPCNKGNQPEGTVQETGDCSGQFPSVTWKPARGTGNLHVYPLETSRH